MGRIVTYAVLIALGVVVTASYGSELAKEIQEKLRKNPEKMCEILVPVSDVLGKLDVPFGAQHAKEVVWRQTAPEGFRAVLALMQVVSVAPCQFNQDAKISIRAFRLIEHDPVTGEEKVVSEVTDFSVAGATQFDHKLYKRLPSWYANNAESFDSAPIVTRDGTALVVDAAKSPEYLFHGWTNPQAKAKPGMNYLVEMEVNISRFARLQMGIDYWRYSGAPDRGWKEDCQETNHCEGYLSRWYGPTDGFRTIRVPDSLMK